MTPFFNAILPGKAIMDEIILTPEQEKEAELIEDNLKAATAVEIRKIARLLASKENQHLFGETEFLVRDAVHRIAARGMDAALDARKKRKPRIQRDLSPLL
jgi:hypothetical protein